MPGLIAKELLEDLLRKRLGFNGLIITDSSTMAGMVTVLPRHEAVPLTIAAGCDMFLFTKNLDEDFNFMRQGIQDGIITLERLNEAVGRILALKASLKLNQKQKDGSIIPDNKQIKAVVGCEEHRFAAKKTAKHSITLVKEEKGVLPISQKKYPRVLLYNLEGKESSVGMGIEAGTVHKFVELLKTHGYEVTIFESVAGWEGFVKPVSDITDQYDLIIYVANLATKSNQTVVRPEWAEPMGADVPVFMHTVPTIFISLENPYHLLDVPRVKTFINTYASTDIMLESLMDKLSGRSKFNGTSPVDAFCGMWDTRL